MIETRLLQYFLAVSEEQSITRAAEYLNITQPTLSKQMMELEAVLGKQLFIRSKKKIILTEEGKFLRSRAREIIALMEKTEGAFKEEGQNISGDVYIGCGEHRSSFSVMQLIREIQKTNPEICFHFFSGNADAILERLDNGLLDIGILLEPELNPHYNYQKLPFTEKWGVLARKDSPLAQQRSITFKELSRLPLIMPTQTSNRNKIELYFADRISELNIVATYNLIYNAGLMVEAEIGYALCIDELINTAGEHPLIFIPIAPAFESNVVLFTKKHQVFSKATKMFINKLHEKFSLESI